MSALLATWNPARGVWETTRANLLCGHLEPFLETWPTSGSMRNGQAFEHPTSVHRTGGSGSSSSPGLLRTPDTDSGGRRNPDRPGATMRLSDQIAEEVEAGTIRV